jgi:hypothetical protein
MTKTQTQKCKLERVGVRHALKLVGKRKRQSFKSPFDLVTKEFGYEVKTMSADSKDKKVHIADSSYSRKIEFAAKHKIEPVLMAIIIGDGKVEIYQSHLAQSIRVSQMRKIGG